MIVYSVTIFLQADVEAEWVEWMRLVHVPEVLKTGCFLGCRMHKVLEAGGAEAVYLMQYRCKLKGDYERYRDTFAAALQKQHTDRYGGRFRGVRQLLEEVAAWDV